jgi:hypothetical protein
MPILKKECHLSFPNIFRIKHDDKDIWYMIPETHENRTIDLYQARDFPNQWVYETTLMRNVQAVDSVFFLYQEKWWLFTSIGTETVMILFLIVKIGMNYNTKIFGILNEYPRHFSY